MSHRPVTLLFLNIIFAIISCQRCNDHSSDNENITGKRVISLSPSITGQIIDLGAEDSLVGVTPYHPPLKKDVAIVGSYINPSIEN